MPTVPRYDQPRVRATPLPGVRATVAPVKPIAQLPDLSGAANAWGDLIQRERQKADQLAVLDARNQLSATKTALLEDPQTGALTRKGKDAFSTPETVLEAWKKRTSEIESRLTSDPQREAFRQQATEIGMAMHDTLQRHVANESAVYDKEQTTTALAQTQDEILKAVSPAERKRLIEVRSSIVADYTRRQGLSQEVRAFRVAAVRSDSHAAVAIQMSDAGQDLAAAAYFTANKDALTADDRAKVEKTLEVGSTRAAGQRNADAILFGPKAAETEADAYARAREIVDPREREETEKRLDTEFRRRDSAEQQARKDRFQSGANFAEQGRRPPPSIWKDLTLQERSAIDSRIEQVQGGRGGAVDWQLWHDLRLQAASDDPKERAKFTSARLDVLRASGKLNNEQFTQLVNAQAKAAKGAATGFDGYRTVAATVTGVVRGLKLDPKKDAREIEILQREVDAEVADWKAAKNTDKIPSQEVQRIVNDLVIKRADGDRRFQSLGTSPEDVTSIDKVPLSEQRRIREQLIPMGIYPSADQIARLYREKLLKVQAGLEPE